MAAKKKKSRKTVRKLSKRKNVKKTMKKKPLKPKKRKPGLAGRARKPKPRKKAPKKAPKRAVKRKQIIIRKKEVKAKVKKPEKKKIIELTPEEMKRISDILSKPLIRQLLVDLGGENAIAIVRNFDCGMSDEDIAKKLKLKISDVRAALNRLHSEGIVAYDRCKDSETGWYSYSWYLNKEKMERWASEQTLRFETDGSNGGEYYICPSCGGSTIFSFESAMEKNFRCEICNHSLEFIDEKKKEELGVALQLRKRF